MASKKKSGTENRRDREKKTARLNEVLNKTPKLQAYFQKKSIDVATSSSTENEQIVEPVEPLQFDENKK